MDIATLMFVLVLLLMKPATNLMKIFAYVEERRKIRSTKDISKKLDALMQPKRVVRLEVKTEEDKSTS
ncbi:hypothetical protein YC2023_017134 [Brassica napus]